MFNINGWEIVIVAMIALLVLGPERLPEFFARAGQLLRQLRRAADEATSEITREFNTITAMAEAQMEEATRPGREPGSPAPPAAPADGNLPTIAPPPDTPDEMTAAQESPPAPETATSASAGIDLPSPTAEPPSAEPFPPLVDGPPDPAESTAAHTRPEKGRRASPDAGGEGDG